VAVGCGNYNDPLVVCDNATEYLKCRNISLMERVNPVEEAQEISLISYSRHAVIVKGPWVDLVEEDPISVHQELASIQQVIKLSIFCYDCPRIVN